MTECKLSCWRTGCNYNFNESCLKDGVVDAKYCPEWNDAPWNLEMNKQ